MADLPDLELPGDPLVDDENGLRTARNFDVIAGSPLHARQKVAARWGVRRGVIYRSPYGEAPDASLVCVRIQVQPDGDAVVGGDGRYLVKAEYDAREGVDEPEPGGPPVYRIKGSLQSEPVDTDANGQPIVNAANEPVGGITKLVPGESVHVEWYTQAPDQITLQAALRPYRGALNREPWLGAMAGSVLCHGVEITEALEGGWYRLAGEFEYRDPIDPAEMTAALYLRKSDGSLSPLTQKVGGWHEVHANMGRREKKTIDGEAKYTRIRMPVLDENGDPKTDAQGNPVLEPVDEPVPLAADGTAAAEGATPVAIVVPLYGKTADFSNLGI